MSYIVTVWAMTLELSNDLRVAKPKRTRGRTRELGGQERVKKLRFRMKSPVGWFFPVGSFAAALAFWFACIVRFGAAPSQAIVAAGCGARCNRNQRVKL